MLDLLCVGSALDLLCAVCWICSGAAAYAPYVRKRPLFGPQHEESALRLWRRRQYSGWSVPSHIVERLDIELALILGRGPALSGTGERTT